MRQRCRTAVSNIIINIAVIGAGAVGAPTALFIAQALPAAKVTVFDASKRCNTDRTFVLANAIWESLQDAGVHAPTHLLHKVSVDVAGRFGGLQLSDRDCHAYGFAHAVGEQDLLTHLHVALAQQANLLLHDHAMVTKLSPDGTVDYTSTAKNYQQKFDLVAVCGVGEHLLLDTGFTFTGRSYPQVALVCTISAGKPGHTVHERLLCGGATTTVPRRDGYGHILLLPQQLANDVVQLPDSEYLKVLRARGWLRAKTNCKLHTRATFTPRQRIAQPATLDRLVLLGASACMMNPIGAQELNLGLRDALALARLLRVNELDNIDNIDNIGTTFVRQRRRDRASTTALIDIAANLIGWDSPGKLTGLGLLATVINLCPPARQRVLGNMVARS